MIVVAVIGVLAALAMPAYTRYVIRGNRAAAQAFMMDVASREKQYLLDARSYLAIANNAAFVNLGVTVPTEVNRNYGTIVVTVGAAPPTFLITATPTSTQQVVDGPLTLSDVGIKTPAANW